jgi:hypothetical protein
MAAEESANAPLDSKNLQRLTELPVQGSASPSPERLPLL